MSKLFFYDGDAPRTAYVPVPQRRHYGFFKFMFDLFMITVTGGLWLVWIFIREMRRH